MTSRGRSTVFLCAFASLNILLLFGCGPASAKQGTNPKDAKSPAVSTVPADDLQTAMDKLQNSLQKPASPFHVSFKKSQSDGYSYQCEAEVSSGGIRGQQTDHSPALRIGNEDFPAATRVRQLSGTPAGGPEWSAVFAGMAMTYLNGHIRDAQPGVQYAGDEQTGGYDVRHYDFDLTGADAKVKKAMMIGNAIGMRQTKDYNVKGSAWVAKDDGRMVKFQFDNIYSFADGETSTMHFEGAVTKQ
jgi:hypothetical protein